MSRFDEIKIGDKEEIKHIITQDDIQKFVELTGDDNKLHVNAEYASKTSFKKPVAHGMLGASFISTIIGTKIPGDGALWFAQSIEFLLPVRIGDELTIRAEVIKKTEQLKLIELQTDIYNQHKQKVTTGVAKVKIIEQVAEAADTIQKKHQKTALIIGGTGGIGHATCLQLAKDGFDIAIHYNSNSKLAQEIQNNITLLGQKSICISADITNYKEVQEMISSITRQLNAISVIVNCATIKIPNLKFKDLEWEDFAKHLDINIKANFFILKSAVPIMEQKNNGKIIMLLTQYIETPFPELLPYITSKAALSGFSKALAVELGAKGITINMVSPGMTNTELIADVPEKVKLLTSVKAPLKRLAEAKDVANTISFLASDKSDYLTGETIRVNGGQVML